jgi:hypothetical protein
MQAYIDLATCRGGMGDGPVPWTAAMQWSKRNGLNRDQTDDLWFIISRMDEFWLEWREKKRG